MKIVSSAHLYHACLFGRERDNRHDHDDLQIIECGILEAFMCMQDVGVS